MSGKRNVKEDCLVTSNLIEVSYLLERNHRLTDVSHRLGSMGAEEILFTLKGEDITLDRRSFLGYSSNRIPRLEAAFAAIQEVLWKKEEGLL